MSELRRHWGLDPNVTFLNHGSFGATPLAILDRQTELRAEMEAEPIRFFVHRVPELWDTAVERGAEFLGADPHGFAYVANATTGVNTVLRSLEFGPGDELIVTNHEYGACRITLDDVAAKTGATVVVVEIPFPLDGPDDIVAAIADAITERSRLLLIDHVTSSTGLVLPIEQIAAVCRDAGVQVLVDGAHGIGMLDLHLDTLGVDYYTGNFHKWGCAPKSAAALWIAEAHRDKIRPLVTSHGSRLPADEPWQRLRNEFDWVGTIDPTAVLCVPETIDFMASLVDGGWAEIRRRNHQLAVDGRELLLQALDVAAPAPTQMLGALATVPLPGSDHAPTSPLDVDPQQARLVDEYGIQVPFIVWPAPPNRFVRISTQLYNSIDDVEVLCDALKEIL